MELREYLEKATAQGASDLFIVAGLPLTCKVNGQMVHMSEDRVMPEDVVRGDRFYLWIKRFLLLPFYGKHAIGSRFFKEWSLRFGNAICCPAVTYHLSNLPGLRFDEEFTVNLDWAMWLTLAARRGTFVYLPERLMQHRISDAMETSSAIADRRRYREDQKIFDALWPRPIARLLMHFYAKNYEGDRL